LDATTTRWDCQEATLAMQKQTRHAGACREDIFLFPAEDSAARIRYFLV
jgi:hypothetical protein